MDQIAFGRASSSIPQIAKKTGLTEQAVRDNIPDAKIHGTIDFYNACVDPAVAFVAGRDVPNLPVFTGAYDIALSGHILGGFGVSA